VVNLKPNEDIKKIITLLKGKNIYISKKIVVMKKMKKTVMKKMKKTVMK